MLCGELHDGYDYTLLIVGHLHEAESECQHRPELHDAIRSARKAFQDEGEIPDFEQLGSMIGDVHGGCAKA